MSVLDLAIARLSGPDAPCTVRFGQSLETREKSEQNPVRTPCPARTPQPNPDPSGSSDNSDIDGAAERIAELLSRPCPDGVTAERWARASEGAERFAQQWAVQAMRLGWTAVELYRVPPLWSRIDLTGAALLIGDRQVIAVTEDSIVIETPSGARLKFRRLGREHLA
jgi:hypothetical protein